MCVCVCVCVCNPENHVPSRLSPQLLCGTSCTWPHDVRICVLWISYDHSYDDGIGVAVQTWLRVCIELMA